MMNGAKKIRIAVVGVGHDHAASALDTFWRLSDLYDVAGWCLTPEDDPERAKHAAIYAKVRQYSYEEVLAMRDLDAVAVECEDNELTRHTIPFAKRGLHVHMDKPGGQDKREFDEMIELFRRSGKQFHTGYMYRYNPALTEAIRLVGDGKLGRVYSVETEMGCYHKDEKRRWLGKFEGGMMNFLGCHLLDVIVRFLGFPDEVIPLSFSTYGGEGAPKDVGAAVLRYDGALGYAGASARECGGFMRRQIVVRGTEGTIEICPIEYYADGKMYADMRVNLLSDRGAEWTSQAPVRTYGPFARYDGMMRDFYECIMGRQNPFTPEYEQKLHDVVLRACGLLP